MILEDEEVWHVAVAALVVGPVATTDKGTFILICKECIN
jgi:hypothetical protein